MSELAESGLDSGAATERPGWRTVLRDGRLRVLLAATGLVAAATFGVVDVRVGAVVLLACVVASYSVTHAFAVAVSRALERSGRFRARGNIMLLASVLALVNIVVAAVLCEALGRPILEARSTTLDEVFGGALMLTCAFVTGPVALVVAHRLPTRSRRGPHRRVNTLIGLSAKVVAVTALPLFAIIMVAAWISGLSTAPPENVGEWLLVLILIPASAWMVLFFAAWTHTSMSRYAQQLRSPFREFGNGDDRMTLYLRPFEEEHRLFDDSLTFEQFLGADVEREVGPFVALGNPTDRIAPVGAQRHYYDDERWQSVVEDLVMRASCIVGVTSASPSTSWELTRIRELGREQRLFLVSPPPVERPRLEPVTAVHRSRFRRALGHVKAVADAYGENNTDEMSRLLSFGKLPAAWSPSGLTTWTDFTAALTDCGYTIDFDDPGPGTVLGFERGGTAIVLARQARTPAEYLRAITCMPTRESDGDDPIERTGR